MKTLVIHASKHGATQQYAEWIASALDTDCTDSKTITADMLNGYDTIIFGGSLYAGMIRNKKVLLKHADLLKQKKLIVFTVGLTPVDSKTRTEAFTQAFPDSLWPSIRHFPLRGRMETDRLGRLERTLFNMVGKAVSKRATEGETQEQAEAADMFSGDVDFMDQESIQPLLDYVRKQVRQ